MAKSTKKPRKTAPKRMGRPPKVAGERRSTYLRVRVTDDEKASLQRRADEAGVSLTDFVRARVFD